MRRQLEPLARHRKLVGIRHIVQGEPDDLSCSARLSAAASRPSTALDLAYDILIYPRHLPVAAEFVARFPTSVSFSITWASPTSGRRDPRPGGATFDASGRAAQRVV